MNVYRELSIVTKFICQSMYTTQHNTVEATQPSNSHYQLGYRHIDVMLNRRIGFNGRGVNLLTMNYRPMWLAAPPHHRVIFYLFYFLTGRTIFAEKSINDLCSVSCCFKGHSLSCWTGSACSSFRQLHCSIIHCSFPLTDQQCHVHCWFMTNTHFCCCDSFPVVSTKLILSYRRLTRLFNHTSFMVIVWSVTCQVIVLVTYCISLSESFVWIFWVLILRTWFKANTVAP